MTKFFGRLFHRKQHNTGPDNNPILNATASTRSVIHLEQENSDVMPASRRDTVILSESDMAFASGIVLFGKDDYTNALKFFQKAQSQDPLNSDITEKILECQQVIKFGKSFSFKGFRSTSTIIDHSNTYHPSKSISMVRNTDDESDTELHMNHSESLAVASSLLNQGILCTRSGLHQEAIKCYNQVFEIYSKQKIKYASSDCYNGCALSMFLSGEFQNAIKMCKIAINLNRDDTEAHNTLGHIYRTIASNARDGTGDYEDAPNKKAAARFSKLAIEEFRLSTPLYQKSYSYKFDKAMLHIDEGHYLAAKKKLQDAKKLINSQLHGLDEDDAPINLTSAKDGINKVLNEVSALIRQTSSVNKVMGSFRTHSPNFTRSDSSDTETISPTSKKTVQDIASIAMIRWKTGVTEKQMKEMKAQLRGVNDFLQEHRSEQQIRKDMEEISKTPQLYQYLKAFKSTFENTYIAARAVSSGTVATDVGGVSQDIVVGLIGLIPFVGDAASSVVDNIANLVQDSAIKRNAVKFLTIALDLNKFNDMIDCIAREIILHINKKDHILNCCPQQQEKGFFNNLIAKCKKVVDVISTKVYGNMFPEGPSKEGHEDAETIIQEFMSYSGDTANVTDTIKFCISKIIQNYEGELSTWHHTHDAHYDSSTSEQPTSDIKLEFIQPHHKDIVENQPHVEVPTDIMGKTVSYIETSI